VEPLDTPLTDYLTALHPIDLLIESHPERHGSPGTACAILRRAGECDRFASVRCDLPRLRARLRLRSLWPAPISCGSTWITSLTSPEATCLFQSPGTACVPHPRAGHFLWIAYYDVPPIDVRQLSKMFLGVACLAASHTMKPLGLTVTMRVISSHRNSSLSELPPVSPLKRSSACRSALASLGRNCIGYRRCDPSRSGLPLLTLLWFPARSRNCRKSPGSQAPVSARETKSQNNFGPPSPCPLCLS
jgi:hypothetical protein